jgi:hypothetical protein
MKDYRWKPKKTVNTIWAPENILYANQFLESEGARMTKDEAKLIKKWRIEEKYSWRMVAQNAYHAGIDNSDWEPPDNQIVGRELCDKAAKILGEDVNEHPWN